MEKSTHTPHYRALREKLVELREVSGLTQRQLADKLGREHSFVWRIEKGERRLDIVEFYWVCEALGQKPAEVFKDLTAQFKACEKELRSKKRA